jgi:signal transduction histidine kinase
MPPTTASSRTQVKARRRAESLSAVAIILVCVGIGTVTLLAGPDMLVPRWVWGMLLLVCVTAAFFPLFLGRWPAVLVFAVSVGSSWALLLTVQGQGMVEVILVVVAAVGTYVVTGWATGAVVVANCVVIVVHLDHQGADTANLVAVTAFYLFIHVAAVTSTYTMAHESRLRTELEDRNVQLTAAAVLLEDSARTAERLRISRELHDLIGHQLTVLNLELEAARYKEGAGSPGTGTPHVDRAAAVAKDLLRDVRSTVGELRDSDSGNLVEALSRMATAVPSLVVDIWVADDVHPNDEQATALVRAAQEVITNTVRHSDAARLWLDVTGVGDGIQLVGHDDGSAAAAYTPGNGLRGLQERVGLLGGRLEVSPRDGFRVAVTLPAQVPPSVPARERTVSHAGGEEAPGVR